MTDLAPPLAKPRLPLPPLVDLLTDVHGYLRLDHADDRPWLHDPAKSWVVFLPGVRAEKAAIRQ